MGIFKESYYIKDSKGKWRLQEEKIAKAPHDFGRWQRSAELDAEKYGDETRIFSANTRGGLNKKVVKVVSSFGPNEKVERTLITTSSKLSKKDKEKYKGIKGVDRPIKR